MLLEYSMKTFVCSNYKKCHASQVSNWTLREYFMVNSIIMLSETLWPTELLYNKMPFIRTFTANTVQQCFCCGTITGFLLNFQEEVRLWGN